MGGRTLLRGGQVFDGTGTPIAHHDVAIMNGRIAAVGPAVVPDPDVDEVIDVSGMTLLPGFFDCHVHVTSSGVDLLRKLAKPFSYEFFEAVVNLEATLSCGITTVRDAGGADLGVQSAVNDGLIDGPRMHIAITMLSQTGGHGDGWLPSGAHVPDPLSHPGRPDGVVDGPQQMRVKVRELVRCGANVIKVCTSGGILSVNGMPQHAHFRADELAVLMAEAGAAGVPVMAHAQATDGIKQAIRAGVRSIEHGYFLDDEAIEMMLQAGTWLVPTLVAPRAVLDAGRGGVPLPSAMLAKARQIIDVHGVSFARAVEAGVKIAMGTDSGVGPHGSNLDELVLMAEGGMKPPQVLLAATSSAAELLGVAGDTGTLVPGKRADIVVVAGDPFDLAGLKGRIRAVYKDGQCVRGQRAARRASRNLETSLSSLK
jgi:imidazolonepropionase-like amidohydrolase